MAPPKKRKNIAGDRQLNIKKFFCQTPEPRKIDEGRVTEATPEKMTGAGETEERGADCSGEGGCSRTVTAPDTGPTADPCPGNIDPAKRNTAKHRTSGWDPEWLNNHNYSPWLYHTPHGEFTICCLAYIFVLIEELLSLFFFFW